MPASYCGIRTGTGKEIPAVSLDPHLSRGLWWKDGLWHLYSFYEMKHGLPPGIGEYAVCREWDPQCRVAVEMGLQEPPCWPHLHRGRHVGMMPRMMQREGGRGGRDHQIAPQDAHQSVSYGFTEQQKQEGDCPQGKGNNWNSVWDKKTC